MANGALNLERKELQTSVTKRRMAAIKRRLAWEFERGCREIGRRQNGPRLVFLCEIRIVDLEAGGSAFHTVYDFAERQIVMLQEHFRDLIDPEMLPPHVVGQRFGERVAQAPERATAFLATFQATVRIHFVVRMIH
jgi:hypothetical protein